MPNYQGTFLSQPVFIEVELYWPQMVETRAGMVPEGSERIGILFVYTELPSRQATPLSRSQRAEPRNATEPPTKPKSKGRADELWRSLAAHGFWTCLLSLVFGQNGTAAQWRCPSVACKAWAVRWQRRNRGISEEPTCACCSVFLTREPLRTLIVEPNYRCRWDHRRPFVPDGASILLVHEVPQRWFAPT